MHANNQYTIVAYYYTIFKCGITIPIYFMSLQKNRMLWESEEKDYGTTSNLFNWSHTFAFLHLLLFVFPQSYAEVM